MRAPHSRRARRGLRSSSRSVSLAVAREVKEDVCRSRMARDPSEHGNGDARGPSDPLRQLGGWLTSLSTMLSGRFVGGVLVPLAILFVLVKLAMFACVT